MRWLVFLLLLAPLALPVHAFNQWNFFLDGQERNQVFQNTTSATFELRESNQLVIFEALLSYVSGLLEPLNESPVLGYLARIGVKLAEEPRILIDMEGVKGLLVTLAVVAAAFLMASATYDLGKSRDPQALAWGFVKLFIGIFIAATLIAIASLI